MKRILSAFVLLAGMSVSAAWAQSSQTPLSFKSTECNADGTVTFRYLDRQAKDVQVDVQFAGRKAMTRDGRGLWSVTLGPAAPDMYPYCFVVDGVSIMDPQCNQYFPNEGFKNSLLEIPSRQGALAHDIRNVPHGALHYISYYSKRRKRCLK